MKFETQLTNDDIQTVGLVNSMSLDQESEDMIFQMFTENIYSDPIGTVIREITSNCFDSHMEAGVDSTKTPVLVSMGVDNGGKYISFTDQGVGMSPDRVSKIYGVYFKTTKRDTNNQIGGFGIGGKTPLAYTNSFYIITRYEGIEYVYNIYIDKKRPAIELMLQTSTDKPNGTTVKVPIEANDSHLFESKTLRQLYYFENLVFEGFSESSEVTNDYSIIKGKHFLYRGNKYSNLVHVCYGRVAYPLDFDALGLDSSNYNVPIALRVEIGELEGSGVTPSREALKYTKENVRILKRKLDLAMEELNAMLSKQYESVRTLKDYYDFDENFGTLYLPDNKELFLGRTSIKKNDIELNNFIYKGLHIPASDDIITKFFNFKVYGKKYKKSRYRSRAANEWDGSLTGIISQENVYHVKGEFKRVVKKQGYLPTLHDSENFYVFKPIDIDNEFVMKELKRVFGVSVLDRYDKLVLKDGINISEKKAEKLIKKLREEVAQIVFSNSDDYDKVEVPEEFILARKKARINKSLLKTTIPVKCMMSGRERLTLAQLKKIKGKIYYGFSEDNYTLDDAWYIFRTIVGKYGNYGYLSASALQNDYYNRNRTTGTIFIGISRQNEKYMKMLGKKAIHVSHFVKTFVSRKVDAIVEDAIISRIDQSRYWNEMFFKKSIMSHVDSDISEKFSEFKNIINKKKNYSLLRYIENEYNIDIEKEMENSEIYKKYKYLSQIVEKNDKLKWLNSPYNFDINQKDHKEFLDIVQVLFEK